jgi:glycosyltransferase involved in cell wall biosynthesis
MSGPPRVLLCTAYFRPGFKAGGPVQSLAAVYDRVPDVNFHVITRDRDLGDATPYPDLDRHGHLDDPAVTYVNSHGLRGHLDVVRRLRWLPADVVYVNSLWSSDFSIVPLSAMALGLIPKRPVLLAPRGELALSARKISRRKKQVVGPFLRRVVLRQLNITWQATSDHEAVDIRAWAGDRAKIIHVPNMTAVSVSTSTYWSPRPSGTPLRVVMVARVARVKNVHTAIRAMAHLPESTLDIYGPLEDADYVRECRALADRLGVSVVFHGAVASSQVHDVLVQHDVLLFPSHGENFGHAIAEALKTGTPVLTSDATPWTPVLHEAGLAVAAATDDAAFGRGLRTLAESTPAQLSSVRDRTLAAFARWQAANDGAAGLLAESLRRLSRTQTHTANEPQHG